MPGSSDRDPDVICREILAEAARQAEAIRSRAEAEARSIVAEAREKAWRARQHHMELAEAEARRRREAMLATLPVETGRLASARLESILESIRETALARLPHPGEEEFFRSVARLAVGAVESMDSNALVLKAPAQTLSALGNGLAEEIRRRSGRSDLVLEIVEEAGLNPREVVLEDGEGHRRWNLSPEARLQRLWPEMRREIVSRTGLGETAGPRKGAS